MLDDTAASELASIQPCIVIFQCFMLTVEALMISFILLIIYSFSNNCKLHAVIVGVTQFYLKRSLPSISVLLSRSIEQFFKEI